MSDALSIGVSGLMAFQKALNVTSNNVSNYATVGYSVEKANFTEGYAQATSVGYMGSGVNVQSVTRSYSELLAGQVRSSQSSYSYFDTYSTQTAQVDDMLSASDTGLTDSLQTFTNSLQELANAPSLTASRQAVLSQAQALTQTLQGYDEQLNTMSASLESQIGTTVDEINSIASNIANLNTQIAVGQASTGQTPNSLMDQRDQLLNQLSQYTTVSASTQPDGEVNVFIGNGQPLVVGGNASSLAAVADQYDASRHNIVLRTTTSQVDITNSITGGTLGGLLDTRSDILDPTRNALGQITLGLADAVNQLQQSGMTPSGTLGTALFAVGAPLVSASSRNTGDATVDTTVSDISGITADDYQLGYHGGVWSLTDTTLGTSVTMTGSGTAADPFQADGMSIVVDGSAGDGDSWKLSPTTNATSGLSVLLSQPAQIAAASAVQASAASANTGAATVDSALATDPTDANLMTPVSIQFTSATGYDIVDSGGNVLTSGSYTSGSPITYNGWSVTLDGTPAAGDSFSVGSNAGNMGDNSNLFAMIDALSSNTLNGGTASLTGVANALVSGTGVLTQRAQANASAQQAVNSSATDALGNLSGVNLDEEAANMVMYQQAYQAAAQIIQTSNSMFQSLLTAIGG